MTTEKKHPKNQKEMYCDNFEQYERFELLSENEREDYWCYECRHYVKETGPCYDEETGKEVQLCEECMEIYK